MKRMIILVFILIILAGSAFAGEMTIEWNYPTEMNASILGFRIYRSDKSIPWGKHKGEFPSANTQMIQIDDPTLRAYQLVLPDGPNYIRMNAIYMQKIFGTQQVAESFFSEQTKVDIKAPDGPPPPPSDLKLKNTAPTKLKVTK